MRSPHCSPPRADHYEYAVMPSPLGLLGLVATDRGLCEIMTGIDSEAAFREYLEKTYQAMPVAKDQKTREACIQLQEYFEGRRRRFDCPLDLNQGSFFQQRVWQALRTIPYGETRSYAWVAQRIRKPGAALAVGSANGRNPIPILVPCHRVIRHNGDIGGYTGGVEKKRFLLHLEKR